jgi:hypothetical protein
MSEEKKAASPESEKKASQSAGPEQAAKAASDTKPSDTPIADKIIADLDRVHVRIPRY